MKMPVISRKLLSLFLITAMCHHAQNSHGQLLQSILSPVTNVESLALGSIKFLREAKEQELDEPPDSTPEEGEEFDFIVVGAGSAGAVMASRMSEIPEVKVLLLEAGHNENLFMDVPLIVNYLQFTDANWKYKTEASNSHCTGLDGQRCNWPRGKVMGGSSVLNYMIATRGNRRDYDRWAESGNTGWSWNDVFPYFKKLENMEIPGLRSDQELHNTNGPMPINYPTYHTKLATGFLEAGQELGYEVLDYNGANQTGFSYLQTTTADGARVSSNKAYLVPAKDRSNLIVSKNSLVSKILINETDKRAYGVEFIKNNEKYTVKARKEVILCAGAIGSSQILMLSGIGPAEHLADMRIPLIKDAPVGKNLMDHIAYGGFVILIDKPDSILTRNVLNPLKPYLSEYVNERQGPFTVPGGCEALGFINVNSSEDSSRPNVELLFEGASLAADIGARKGFGVTDSLWYSAYGKVDNKHAWTVLPMLLHPLSRGEILLADKNIMTHPRIIPNYMSHPEDVRTLIAGIRATQRVIESKSMQQFGSKLYEVPFPGCKSHEYDSDGYWECALRTLTFNIYHYSGTAKMGPEGDSTAVVNPKLQVHGVKRLRVCDGSIIPEIVTGHPNVPIMMIAEKLSDMVKEHWDYPTEK